MLNLTQLRKDNAAKSSDLQKQKRDHEKRIRDHEKRLSDLKEILEKSQSKSAELNAKIESDLIDGTIDVEPTKDKLHNEELNIKAYTGAITALGFAIQRENELIQGINNSLAEIDREELDCKLIEAARVYNKQAAELAKTLNQMLTLIDEAGNCEKVKCIYTGFSNGVRQLNDGSIVQVFHGIRNMPILFIKDSDGEELPADLRNEPSRQIGKWQHFPIVAQQ